MVFPNITFTCNGSITKLIAGVNIKNITSKVPSLKAAEVQIWRKDKNKSDSYIKIESFPLNATQVNLNVIELAPPTPIRFQEGDILGVYQPESNESRLFIRFQMRDGPINYIQNSALSSFSLVGHKTSYDYPLVTVEISSGIYCYLHFKNFIIAINFTVVDTEMTLHDSIRSSSGKHYTVIIIMIRYNSCSYYSCHNTSNGNQHSVSYFHTAKVECCSINN